jgi:GNAT superfamily N-acetyltransferase
MRKIRIEEIKLKDLKDFADPFFNRSKSENTLPISPQRVLAHTHNPCARPDDIVLLVAFIGNECIGYHGLLPGLLKHDNKVSRVFWATTFYVSAAHRGKGIGKLLIEKIKSLNVDFVVTGMTRAAEKTYLRSGLKTLEPIEFYQLRMEKVIRFKLFYQMAKGLLYRYCLSRQPCDFQEFNYKQVDQINIELKKNKVFSNLVPVFHRDIEMVNWMLKYPWVLSRDTAEVRKENYHFARVRDFFKYIALEIYSQRDNALKGFLVLSVSHKKGKTIIKILDYYLKDLSDLKIIFGLSLKLAAHHLADRIDIPSEFQNYFQDKFLHKRLLKKKTRSYGYHPESTTSPLSSSADRIALNYCDGDTAFT